MSAAAPSLLIDEPDHLLSSDHLLSHVEMLDQLARTGFEIAEAIGAQVKAMTSGDEPADPAVLMALSRTYERMVRTVRFTLVLHDRLAKAAKDQGSGAAKDRKTTLIRIVKRIAETEGQDSPTVTHTGWKAGERLERDDIYGDILNRPVSELIAMICKDLGLSPDWPKLAEEAWARDERASGAPGTPLKPFPLWGKRHDGRSPSDVGGSVPYAPSAATLQPAAVGPLPP